MNQRTFRIGSAIWLIIPFFGILPMLFFTFPAIYHLLSGTPMMFSNGKYSHSSHVGSTSEIAELLAFSSIFPLACVFFMCFSEATITVNDDGIVSQNYFGKILARLNWTQVDHVNRIDGGRSVSFKVRAGSKAVRFNNGWPKYSELFDFCKERAKRI